MLLRTLSSAASVFLLFMAASFGGADPDRGKDLFLQGKYTEAVQELGAVGLDNPKAAHSLLYLGASHFNLRNYGEAINAILKSVRLDPTLDQPIVRHYLAMSFYKESMYYQSKIEFENLLRSDPKSKLVGVICEHLAQIEKITSENRKVSAATKRWYLDKGLGLMHGKNFPGASNYFQEIMLMDPEYENARVLLASCCNHMGLYTRTISLVGGRDDLDSLYLCGFAAFHLGEYARTVASMARVWEGRGKADAAFFCGRAHRRLNRPELAGKYLRLAAEADARLAPKCMLELGILCFNSGNVAEAGSFFRKAAESSVEDGVRAEANLWLSKTGRADAPPR